MGGIGSGRASPNKRTLTTDCLQLSAQQLRKDDVLNSGNLGTISWGDSKDNWIFFQVTQSQFKITYNLGAFSSFDQPDTTLLNIVYEACRFGGNRPYFICPNDSCSHRVVLLYSYNSHFQCRKCLNLAYPCQSEGAIERGYRRARKVRIRLGGTISLFDPFPVKPKGMHWKTYNALSRNSTRDATVAMDAAFKKLGCDVEAKELSK